MSDETYAQWRREQGIDPPLPGRTVNAIERLREFVRAYGHAVEGSTERQEGAEALAAVDALYQAAPVVLDQARDGAHDLQGEQWGYDAAGIHSWEPGEPNGCHRCEALDALAAAVRRIEGDQ